MLFCAEIAFNIWFIASFNWVSNRFRLKIMSFEDWVHELFFHLNPSQSKSSSNLNKTIKRIWIFWLRAGYWRLSHSIRVVISNWSTGDLTLTPIDSNYTLVNVSVVVGFALDVFHLQSYLTTRVYRRGFENIV